MSIKVVVYSALAIAGAVTVVYNWKAINETYAAKRKAKAALREFDTSVKTANQV